MATIIPIQGIRYATDKINDLNLVVTPPYDIIDAAAQAGYYTRNPYNAIRLELGQIYPTDDEKNNRYTRAADFYQQWQKQGVLQKEAQPALYLYEQEFILRGARIVRTGFICGVQLEPYSQGNILPHEETLSKPKADRLQLMQACKANFSPVFGLYADAEQKINQALSVARQSRPADVEFTDDLEEKHRLWVITDPATLDLVVREMAARPIYIADGHHRYETALGYAQEMQAQGQTGFDVVLMTLVNRYDPGMLILPTHRLVKNIPNLNLTRLASDLKDNFEIESFALPADKADYPQTITHFIQQLAQKGETRKTFGFYAKDMGLNLLTLNPDSSLLQTLDPQRSEAWRNLDVTILDYIILDRMLGIGSEERKNQDHLTYTRSEIDAISKVDAGEEQLAFFLNPTLVEEVTEVAAAGDKMPQKSTYFYPKLITGLVFNPLGE